MRPLRIFILVGWTMLLVGASLTVGSPVAAETTETSYSYVLWNGESNSLRPPEATFRMDGTAGQLNLFIEAPGEWWTIHFAAPYGETLTPGTFSDAERYNSFDHPGLDVSGGSACSNIRGSFIIRSISADTDGGIIELDASFTQYCGTADVPPLRGVVKFFAPAVGPVVLTSSNPSLVQGQPVTLTAGIDTSGEQLPTGIVTFFDGDTSIGSDSLIDGLASLTTADLLPGVHSLSASYSGDENYPPGVSQSISQTVADGTLSFWFRSTAHDSIGRGAAASFIRPRAGFGFQGNAEAVRIDVMTENSRWAINISAPQGEILQAGTYLDTERSSSPGHAGLDVSGNGSGCNYTYGSLVINNIETGEGGRVFAFDATFVHHCEWPSAPPMEGRIRTTAPTDTSISVTTPVTYEAEDQDITVSVTSPSGAMPTGQVIVSYGENQCTKPLVEGMAKCPVGPSELPAGVYYLHAFYEPDTVEFLSSVRDGWLDVRPAPTTLRADPVNVVDSLETQTLVLRAVLASQVTNLPLRDKSVSFTIRGVTNRIVLCSAITDEEGVAQCSLPFPAIAVLVISQGYTATFEGTNNYWPSSSDGLVEPITVGPDPG